MLNVNEWLMYVLGAHYIYMYTQLDTALSA